MSQNQWNIGVNAYIWQRSIDYSMNNAQESDAWKQAKLMIWMHLLQKISIENNWFLHEFPTSMYTQTGRQPYLFFVI